MPFMVIDDKGGEIVDKDMNDGKDLDKIRTWIRKQASKLRRIKRLGQEMHTSRGSKLMNS